MGSGLGGWGGPGGVGAGGCRLWFDAVSLHVGDELLGDLSQHVLGQACHAQHLAAPPVRVVAEGDKLGGGRGTGWGVWVSPWPGAHPCPTVSPYLSALPPCLGLPHIPLHLQAMIPSFPPIPPCPPQSQYPPSPTVPPPAPLHPITQHTSPIPPSPHWAQQWHPILVPLGGVCGGVGRVGTLYQSTGLGGSHTCTMSLSATFPREEMRMSSPSNSTMAAGRGGGLSAISPPQTAGTPRGEHSLTVKLSLADPHDDDGHGELGCLEGGNSENIWGDTASGHPWIHGVPWGAVGSPPSGSTPPLVPPRCCVPRGGCAAWARLCAWCSGP